MSTETPQPITKFGAQGRRNRIIEKFVENGMKYENGNVILPGGKIASVSFRKEDGRARISLSQSLFFRSRIVTNVTIRRV